MGCDSHEEGKDALATGNLAVALRTADQLPEIPVEDKLTPGHRAVVAQDVASCSQRAPEDRLGWTFLSTRLKKDARDATIIRSQMGASWELCFKRPASFQMQALLKGMGKTEIKITAR